MTTRLSGEMAVKEVPKIFSPLMVAFFLVLYVFLPSFILSAFLLLRVGSPAGAYLCAHAALLGTAVYLRREITWREIVVFIMILFVAHGLSWYFLDMMHDGLAYFQPAIRRIAGGFNPVYDGYMDLGRAPDVWSEVATYYPKSVMYFAACLTAALGDIQFGKVSHVLLFAATLFYTAHVKRGESLLKKCLWYAACLNPIIALEWTTLVIDGDLSALCLIGLLFANGFFRKKVPSGVEFALGVMSLSLLFGVKTTGFPYGSIIIFFICVNCLWEEYRKRQKEGSGSCFGALRKSCALGLRLGGMVILVSCVMNFHPYITNLREGKNIFYPAVQSFQKETSSIISDYGDTVYPLARNRVTRLLFSIFSHPGGQLIPARLRNPLSSPVADWKVFENAYHTHTGGLGPLFGLLLCVAILLQVLLRGRGNLWLWLTLLLMTFIQPYAWTLRYAPFVWLFPFLCLDTLPERKGLFLSVPLLLALFNTGGMAFFFCRYQWSFNGWIRELLEPHQGETVFLDRSIFEFDGVFDRFHIKQEYVNPEEIVFHRNPGLGHLAQSRTGTGVNFFFAEDLLPLPEFPLSLREERALPWLKMSEGLIPVEDYQEGAAVTVWRSYSNRVKFFMKVDRKPEGDQILTLTGKEYPATALLPDLSLVVFVNDRSLGTWTVLRTGDTERAFVVPRNLLEEAFESEGHLLTLMLRIPSISSGAQSGGRSSCGLELKSI
ncbi:MAG: hypothetical protein LBR61_07725, partial [Synergistaceae bacterium]|nr:hypothetical protein [Synergistaceae bacterium]